MFFGTRLGYQQLVNLHSLKFRYNIFYTYSYIFMIGDGLSNNHAYKFVATVDAHLMGQIE